MDKALLMCYGGVYIFCIYWNRLQPFVKVHFLTVTDIPENTQVLLPFNKDYVSMRGTRFVTVKHSGSPTFKSSVTYINTLRRQASCWEINGSVSIITIGALLSKGPCFMDWMSPVCLWHSFRMTVAWIWKGFRFLNPQSIFQCNMRQNKHNSMKLTYHWLFKMFMCSYTCPLIFKRHGKLLRWLLTILSNYVWMA